MLMIEYKNAVVDSELKHIMDRLRDPAVAADSKLCDELMKRFSELKHVTNVMAKRLGDRVVLH
jgi:DNA primase